VFFHINYRFVKPFNLTNLKKKTYYIGCKIELINMGLFTSVVTTTDVKGPFCIGLSLQSI